MYDPGFIAQSKKAVALKPRKFLTVPILMAVVLKESNGEPYFNDTKPGSEFKMNAAGALSYIKKHADGTKERKTTGFKEADIRNMIKILPKIGTYCTSGIMVNQLAKFRFEPSYWERNDHLPSHERFLASCSWGLCQIMGTNIRGASAPDLVDCIERFKADVGLQLLYGAGMLEELLEQSDGDVNRMYRGYNSGNVNSQDPVVVTRAKEVAAKAAQIEAYLRSQNDG